MDKVKFTTQRVRLTELAIRHLEDKSATVRRHAIALINKLIVTHPFSMHGGSLNLGEWEERYLVAKAQLGELEKKERENAPQGLEAMEREDEDEDEDEEEDEAEADEEDEDEAEEDEEDASEDGDGAPQTTKKRRTTKVKKEKAAAAVVPPTGEGVDPRLLGSARMFVKYHEDALRLIRQIEGAIPKINELLVSTGRAEVLEAMDFFKIAWEYRFESAKVRDAPVGMERETLR
jgi:condensin complex subunit 1